jgi:hypothetical protein
MLDSRQSVFARPAKNRDCTGFLALRDKQAATAHLTSGGLDDAGRPRIVYRRLCTSGDNNTEHVVAPETQLRVHEDAAMGIVITGNGATFKEPRFRTGVQKALIYFWCSATPTLVFTIRNTKSSVWYGQSRSFTAPPHLKKK